jgi:hypothetical protein
VITEVKVSETPPEPEMGLAAVALQVRSRPTEKGFEVEVLSKPVNIKIEMDLDESPEFTWAILQGMPQVIEQQMDKWIKKEE